VARSVFILHPRIFFRFASSLDLKPLKYYQYEDVSARNITYTTMTNFLKVLLSLAGISARPWEAAGDGIHRARCREPSWWGRQAQELCKAGSRNANTLWKASSLVNTEICVCEVSVSVSTKR